MLDIDDRYPRLLCLLSLDCTPLYDHILGEHSQGTSTEEQIDLFE